MTGGSWISYGICGSGIGNFHTPDGITVGNSNEIYVTDNQNYRLVRIDNMFGGGWVDFGSYGSGVGEFDWVTDVAVGNLATGGLSDYALLEPHDFGISAYPNPFNSAVTIFVETLHATSLQIEIFDIVGRYVAQLPSPSVPLPAGEGGNSFSLWEKVSEGRMRAEFTWQPEKSVGSGVYLVRAKIGDESVTKRVVLIK